VSRFQKPLDHNILWATGDLILRAFLDVELKDDKGNWHKRTHRVDSATDMTTFPAHKARQMNLPMPKHAAIGITHEQTGLEIRSGVIRAAWSAWTRRNTLFLVFSSATRRRRHRRVHQLPRLERVRLVVEIAAQLSADERAELLERRSSPASG